MADHVPTIPPVSRPAGSHEPLAEGELVLLRDRRDRRHLVVLRAGAEWHTHKGVLLHDDVIGQPEGRAIRTTGNMELIILRPTRSEYITKMKRGAQVVYPKDQAMIVSLADIRPGMTVVEAGAGSGALTLALLDAVGPTGKVISFERRDDHLPDAIRNVETWHGGRPDHWEVHLADIADNLAGLRPHRVVLDVLEPWAIVDAAGQALAPGGILLTYTPTVTQVMRVREVLEADGRFADLHTQESLVRPWDLDGLAVRPAHRMVAHTAFLTTARRVASPEEGGPPTRARRAGPGVRWIEDTAAEALADGDGAADDPPRGGTAAGTD
jgi:tRNA (adenine57-N1/adenine58-N1)-methyltransferase catalytic subunit